MARQRGPLEEASPLERITTRDDDVEKAAAAGVFGYAAGKSIIAKRIVKLFPAHKAYTELFCGSAALYFTKEGVETEVLNDRDEEVAGALKAIQACTKEELAKLATMNWKSSPATFAKVKKSTPTDRAGKLYKFLYIMRFSYGKNRSSYSPPSEGQDAHRVVKQIEAKQPRMKGTTILCGDYEEPLRKYDGPGAFHFLDPPYKGYKAPGRVGEKDFDEPRFRKMLEGVKGRFLVTYGVKGDLDTSGFEVKRMRQRRTIGAAKGASKDAFLTHLLVSNFKIAAKRLGPFELDDVVGVMDVGPDGERFMPTGSRTMVSVPEQIGAPERAWKNDDPLLCYAEKAGPVEGVAQIRFAGAVCKLDLAIPVGEGMVAWTFDVQRAPVVGDPAEIAKGYTTEGSRFFRALDGAGAEVMKGEVEANAVALIDRPHVELGMQTADVHEYVLSKSAVFEGVLRVERDVSLGAKHPWLASYSNRYPTAYYDFPVLKSGAPMPPCGVSALPESLERVVPAPLRFWTMKGEEAAAAREALAVSKLLASDSIAFVDGELARVEHTVSLVETPVELDVGPDWPIRKALALHGGELVEVFGPAEIAKAGDAPVFCDAGAEGDGLVEPLVKALLVRSGDYVVCALDGPGARSELAKLGEVFRFRPGHGAPVDAGRRLFVTSFPVEADVERFVPRRAGLTKLAFPVEIPDEELVGLAKLSLALNAYLVAKYADPRKALEDIGPPNEWSGGVAMAIGPENRAKLKAAWEALGAEEKRAVEAKFHANFSKAIFYGPPGPGDRGKKKPGVDLYTPSDDTPDLGKADFNLPDSGIGPGTLVPAQGNDAYRRRARYGKVGKVVAGALDETRDVRVVLKDGAEDEHVVYGIVLEPDTVDAQQDIYSAEEVRTAAHRYMEEFQNAGLMHRRKINDKAKVIESFLAPCDFTSGGQPVKKGTWVMAMRVIDDALWAQCKDKRLDGFSIGGSAQRTPEATAKAMRKIEHQGIPVTIDRPKGYVQHGRGEDGKTWEREYKLDYGYIPKTKGGDGEGIDVFLGPNDDAPTAYWIAQKSRDGGFDEWKVMLGFDSPEAAKKAYLDHVPAKFFGEMHAVPVSQMKGLLGVEPEHKMQPEGGP